MDRRQVAEVSSEIADSSGSEFQVEQDDASSSDTTGTDTCSKAPLKRKFFARIRKTLPAKKGRTTPIAPQATSTPKTAVFTFTDGESDEPGSVRLQRKDTTEADRLSSGTVSVIIDRMTKMEEKLLKAVGELQQDVKDRDQQILLLTRRVNDLEGRICEPQPRSSNKEQKRKPSNVVKATTRQAFQDAETEKGLVLNTDYQLDSAINKGTLEFAWKFTKTAISGVEYEDFKLAARRYYTSLKERACRERKGKEGRHKDNLRKFSRKNTKSRNRLVGVRMSDLPPHKITKYEKAFRQPQLMSTEESDVDDNGERVFRVRQRQWESAELKNAKKIADECFAKKTESSRIGRTKRVTGPPSATPAPAIDDCEGWTSTNYGVL